MNMDERFLRLNIGGQKFLIERAYLTRYPNSRLALLTKDSPSYVAESSEHFFSTSPRYFDAILDVYREKCKINHGLVDFGKDTNAMEIMAQLDFWGLEPSVLTPNVFHRVFNELKLLRRLTYNSKVENIPGGIPGKIYQFFEIPRSSRLAVLWCVLAQVLILISLMMFMLEALPGARTFFNDGFKESYNNKTLHRDVYLFIHSRPQTGWIILEVIITLLLLTEHVLRFAVAPSKRTFYKNFFNVADGLGIFPVMIMYILILVQHFGSEVHALNNASKFIQVFVALHCARVFRIFRYMKHACNFRSMRIVLYTLRESTRELSSWLLIIVLTMYVFANMVYFAEMSHPHGNDHSFKNPFSGLWWAITTVTMVGYGDIIPLTFLGKSFGSICLIFGVLSTGITASILNHHMARVYALETHISAYDSKGMKPIYDKANEYLAEMRQNMCSDVMSTATLGHGSSYTPLIESRSNSERDISM